MNTDEFNARDTLHTQGGDYTIYRLDRLEQAGHTRLDRLPVSIRILLEGVLRSCGEKGITRQDVLNLAGWKPTNPERVPMPVMIGRVVMQDFSGVPVMNDLAAMRSAMLRLGSDPQEINPRVPVDLVIDHSVQVDFYGSADSMRRNTELEFQRNQERYEFLHWCQQAFDNFRVIPPASGIIHQVNLEYLSQGVLTRTENGARLAYPDTVVGTDSHTTMVNGAGIVGWGVGGIEAVAAMLGEPIEMVTPDVVGFKLTGSLPEGTTPTDLTLTIIQMLRKQGVVDKFVEFYGPGLSSISPTDRAMIANMTPESGATMIYFPVDEHTLRYFRLTGRSDELVDLVETYFKAQGLFRDDQTPDPEFTTTLSLDLGTVEPALAGPKRPQDRVPLRSVKSSFHASLTAPKTERGFGLQPGDLGKTASLSMHGSTATLGHGAVVIAAITSCTNTSNPTVMVAAGLLAQKAVEKGLTVKPYVKTSLAPGSKVVASYLDRAGLLDSLAKLGFNLVGFGCTTCIGNSGPLPEEVVKAITSANLVATAVLSGNRNFEGRVHPYTQANYLASPPLVVAYALAGTVDIDLINEPLGLDRDGRPVFLRDVWPSSQEVMDIIHRCVTPELFRHSYASLITGNAVWNNIKSAKGNLYQWSDSSSYLQEPPFFTSLSAQKPQIQDIRGARALAVFGDSITTDHISPAGDIAVKSPAGQYLISLGVAPQDFNSYGSRRGNDRVMTRGTFANIRIKNLLLGGVEGGYTLHFPDGETTSIYEAAMKYQQEGIPLVVLAGKEYGTGSSRDWAAKGALLLGVRAVIAESYERIHRSNLAGMGVLPLQFLPGETVSSLGLTGKEIFAIEGVAQSLSPRSRLTVRATAPDGHETRFTAILRLDTAAEIEYYRDGGILNTFLYESAGLN